MCGSGARQKRVRQKRVKVRSSELQLKRLAKLFHGRFSSKPEITKQIVQAEGSYRAMREDLKSVKEQHLGLAVAQTVLNAELTS
jgi:hypothetical protein